MTAEELNSRKTPEERSETARRGGIASGEAKRRRKTLAELAKKLAQAEIVDDKTKAKLKAAGFDEEDLVNNSLVTMGVMRAAAKGDTKAIEKWQQLTEVSDKSEEVYYLPACVLGKAFIDVNRTMIPNKQYVFKGGRGGLKSSYVSLKIIELIRNNPAMSACVVRKVGNTLKDSVYSQLKWAINTLGMTDDFIYRKSPLEIEYKKTGQIIYFRGADEPEKLKSIKPTFGYIGILWLEELDQFNGAEEVRNIKQSVLRGGSHSYDFASYNPPRSKSNWVNRQELIPDKNREIHTSTYLDAPAEWLGQKFLDDAEHLKETQPESYEHEYMGVANGEGGNVFENLELRDITDEEIGNMDRLYAGVDWGYYPDYYAFVLCYYDHARETIYLIDEHCVNKQTNKDTAAWILKNHKTTIGYCEYGVVCDSAEPKSIADYIDLGIWNAKAAYKPPGSVGYGMKWLQGRTIVIDQRRTPMAFKEITQYEYDRDREGNVISGYPDRDNHVIDALRYSLSPVALRRFTQA